MFTIYLHTNRINNKKYVGQTEHTMEWRWRRHVYQAQAMTKWYIFQLAIRKYGPEAFDHLVLETVETLKDANEAEARWIRHFRSNERPYGYNLEGGGGKSRKHQDTRLRASQSMRKAYERDPTLRERCTRHFKGCKRPPETVEKIAAANRGRVYSAEVRAKMSAGQMGRISPRKGCHLSEETKALLRAAAIGRKMSPEAKAKMSASRKGLRPSDETRAKMSAASKGRKASPKTIEKLRKAHLGMKASPETREKMRKAWANSPARLKTKT